MDQTVPERNVPGGSKAVRPDRRRPTNVSGGSKVVRDGPLKAALIKDNFAYGRSAIPVPLGSFCGGPAPPLGSFCGGPAPPTGTGTQIPVAWGNFPGGPPPVTDIYGSSGIPVAWPNFPGGPPLITDMYGIQGNSSGGPAPPTGTGTFKRIWSKSKSKKLSRIPFQIPSHKSYSVIDDEIWPDYDGPVTGKMVIIDGKTGKPVCEDPADFESDREFFENMHRKSKELGFDLSPPDSPPSEIPPKIPHGITYLTMRDRNLMVFQHRENLKYHEERFKRQYSYGTTAPGSSDPFTGDMELRHCLTGRSNDAFCWMEKSSGIKWVGIYGINSLCVVTLSGHVDWKRVHGGLATTDPKTVLSLFRKCVLSELEDLADPCNKACRTFEVPFCVASATLDTFETPNESDVETSSVDYAAKAIDFVRSSGLLPEVEDSDAAIRLAISAFERLIRKKCEAEEIEVTVMSGRKHGIPTVKDLDISEIGDYLAMINTTSETVV